MKHLPAVLAVYFLPLLTHSQPNFDELASTPKSNGPLKVEIGYNVINITDINEKDETIDFDGAIFLRWKDPRLAYEDSTWNGDYTIVPKVIYQGFFAVHEIYNGWRPFIYIANGIGNRNTSNQLVEVWPDGTAQYSEIFSASMETPMDMRLYPFDKQDLIIYIHPSSYNRDELIFIPSPELSNKWDQNLGIAEWKRMGDLMEERAEKLYGYDENVKTISEFLIILQVSRHPTHVIFSIIFPMVLLVALTWVVFWLEKRSVTERINISFIGILSVVAYYFVIQDSIPKINYLTLIDVFIIETFLILAGSVVISLVINKLDTSGKEALGDKIDRVCRIAFPASYVLITLIVYVIFRLVV